MRHAKRIWLKNRLPRQQFLAVVIVLLVAGIGVYLLARGHAATPYVASEAETGTLAGGAGTIANSSASGGSAVQFGQAAVTGNGHYQVHGRFLYDPCGQQVVPRGVEDFDLSPFSSNTTMAAQVAKTGANDFRLIISDYSSGNPSASQIDSYISSVMQDKMMPDIGVDTNVPSDYLDPTIETALQKYQNDIVIHAMGEGTEATEAEWESDAITGIAQLRAAGYTAPLYVLANDYGRDIQTLLDDAPAVLASDPLKNIVFGWQAYWGEPGNYYQNLFGMTLDQAFQKASQAPFMIQVGLSYESDPSIDPTQIIDYTSAMQDAQTDNIGWLWWDWQYGGSAVSLTTNGTYGDWTKPFGLQVVSTNVGSLSSAVRTSFMNTGTCQ